MIWQVPTSNAERIEDQKIDLPLNSLSIPFGFVYVYNAFLSLKVELSFSLILSQWVLAFVTSSNFIEVIENA